MRTLALALGVASLGMRCALAAAHDVPRLEAGRDRSTASSAGAVVPWQTYEAETASTNGSVIAPDFKSHSPAREASGRQCVRLTRRGDFTEFVARAEAQGVVVRYSIPDSAPATDATLDLLINGQPVAKLSLTSTLSHLFGPYPFSNDATLGSHRNFWDETRVMAGSIRAGDKVRIEVGSDDNASEYLIDFVELETVSAPLAQPENALSILDFGAVPNDAADDRDALIAAIEAAKAQKRSVWIPQGDFVIKGAINVADVAIQGAGIWHTSLVGVEDYSPANRVSINGTGSNILLADFAIFGKLNYRNDAEPNDAIGGSFGTGSTIRNLWIEHTKAGIWVVNSDGLVIENCRFRNTIADGINLCVGMRNSIVRNCAARGTGDDCFAMWPATYTEATYPHGGNRFEHCTAQFPFLAQGFSIYGGENNSVTDCTAIDIPYGCGLFASTTFPTELGFLGATTFARSRVVRAGDREGAIGTVANRTDLVGLRFDDIEVVDSPNDAIRFMSVNGRALRDAVFKHIVIQNVGTAGAGYGVVSADDAVGSVSFSHVRIENAKSGNLRNVSKSFEVIRGEETTDLQK